MSLSLWKTFKLFQLHGLLRCLMMDDRLHHSTYLLIVQMVVQLLVSLFDLDLTTFRSFDFETVVLQNSLSRAVDLLLRAKVFYWCTYDRCIEI